MLRILYIACDVFAALFAVVSPIAIFHWLVRSVNVPLIGPYLTPLNSFFDPMNAILEGVFHPPAINYNEQMISTTQGLVACFLTAGFFALNFLSEYLKTTEQRKDVNQQASLQRQRLKKLQESQNHHHQKVVTNRRYLVHVNYDFTTCPTGGNLLEEGFTRQAGSALERLPSYMTLEFPALAQSIEYCMAASQALLGYYATLRPVDPQPPFRIGIHVMDAAMPIPDASSETRKLVGFAAVNQVVFTQDVRDVLDANGQAMSYNFQSIGLYGLEGRQQELFRLFNSKPKHTF